jgi:hypothetical protein
MSVTALPGSLLAISVELANWFEALAVRARMGEFDSALVVLSSPDGRWHCREKGVNDPLRRIGMLESAKADILIASETGQKSSL